MGIHLEEFIVPQVLNEDVSVTPNFTTQCGLLLTAGHTSSSATSQLSNGMGMFTVADEFAVSASSQTIIATPNSSSVATAKALTNLHSAGGIDYELAVQAITSSILTLRATDPSPAAKLAAVLCFGGLSETPDLREITISGNNTQTFDLGWGGAPDLILGMSSWTTATAGSGVENHAHLGFHASTWDGTDEAAGGVFYSAEDAAGEQNTDTSRAISENTWLIRSEDPSGTRDIQFELEIIHDPAVAGAGKYQVITTNYSSGGGDCRVYLMALRGIRAQYVSNDAPTVAHVAHPVTGAGFRPTHVMNWNIEHETADVVVTHGGFSLYMADASNNYGIWCRDKTGVAETVTERRWEDSQFCRAEDHSNSNNRYLSTLTSLGADGHTETPTVVNTAYKRGFLYLADDIRTRRHLPILGTG